MREFRRSRKFWVLTIIWSVFMLGALFLGAEAIFKVLNMPVNVFNKCVGVWVFYLVICMIIHATFPEDFEYYVEVRDNIMIFDFAENDHRVISTPFWMVSKTRKILVISDGYAIVPLQYNKSVLRFLKKYETSLISEEKTVVKKEEIEKEKKSI